MKDPSLPTQKAVFAALSGDAGLGADVYDRVPIDTARKITAKYPYVHIGEDQVTSEADQCFDKSTIYATVHVWSRAPGKVEAKTIMARVCELLDVNLDIEGFGVVGHAVDTGPYHLDGGDGLTSHSVVTFRYRLAPAA
jgi:hypothetical protein